MPTTVKLMPFHDEDGHEQIGQFGFSGSVPMNAGTIVAIEGSGLMAANSDTKFLGDLGASYNNVFSQRYGVKPYVVECQSGAVPVGMMLYDVREYDENGEKLIYRPKSWADRRVVPSGMAVPLATRGIFTISGVEGTVTAGSKLYVSGGKMTATAIGGGTVVGQALSAKDNNNWTVVHVKI